MKCCLIRLPIFLTARSMASKGKSDSSQVKESTDSSTTLEDDDSKGMVKLACLHELMYHYYFYIYHVWHHPSRFHIHKNTDNTFVFGVFPYTSIYYCHYDTIVVTFISCCCYYNLLLLIVVEQFFLLLLSSSLLCLFLYSLFTYTFTCVQRAQSEENFD